MESAEVGSLQGRANSDVSQSNSVETPIIDRIPQVLSGSAFKKRTPPRPTLEKPRTTLLLPKTGLGWFKTFGATVSAVAVMASALFGIRTLSQNGCEEFGVDRQTVYSKDGLAVNVRPDVLTGSFGVRIGSVLLGDLRSEERRVGKECA